MISIMIEIKLIIATTGRNYQSDFRRIYSPFYNYIHFLFETSV